MLLGVVVLTSHQGKERLCTIVSTIVGASKYQVHIAASPAPMHRLYTPSSGIGAIVATIMINLFPRVESLQSWPPLTMNLPWVPQHGTGICIPSPQRKTRKSGNPVEGYRANGKLRCTTE